MSYIYLVKLLKLNIFLHSEYEKIHTSMYYCQKKGAHSFVPRLINTDVGYVMDSINKLSLRMSAYNINFGHRIVCESRRVPGNKSCFVIRIRFNIQITWAIGNHWWCSICIN